MRFTSVDELLGLESNNFSFANEEYDMFTTMEAFEGMVEASANASMIGKAIDMRLAHSTENVGEFFKKIGDGIANMFKWIGDMIMKGVNWIKQTWNNIFNKKKETLAKVTQANLTPEEITAAASGAVIATAGESTGDQQQAVAGGNPQPAAPVANNGTVDLSSDIANELVGLALKAEDEANLSKSTIDLLNKTIQELEAQIQSLKQQNVEGNMQAAHLQQELDTTKTRLQNTQNTQLNNENGELKTALDNMTKLLAEKEANVSVNIANIIASINKMGLQQYVAMTNDGKSDIETISYLEKLGKMFTNLATKVGSGASSGYNNAVQGAKNVGSDVGAGSTIIWDGIKAKANGAKELTTKTFNSIKKKSACAIFKLKFVNKLVDGAVSVRSKIQPQPNQQQQSQVQPNQPQPTFQ